MLQLYSGGGEKEEWRWKRPRGSGATSKEADVVYEIRKENMVLALFILHSGHLCSRIYCIQHVHGIITTFMRLAGHSRESLPRNLFIFYHNPTIHFSLAILVYLKHMYKQFSNFLPVQAYPTISRPVRTTLLSLSKIPLCLS